MRVFYPRARVVLSAIIENGGVSQPAQDFEVTPRSITVVRNSYKQADSWTVEFDARDFPIAPALVRTGNIEIYVWDNEGMENPWKIPQGVQCTGTGVPVVSSLLQIAGRVQKELSIFIEPTICGILDNVNVDYSDDGRTVSLEGQDYTALFLEHKFQKKKTVVGERLDAALSSLIREVDKRGILRLQVDTDVKLPTVGKASGITNSKRGYPIKKGDSYWDVMYKLAISAGFVLYVRGLSVILTTPQNLTKANVGRIYKMKWGDNIESVHMERKMGKQRTPQIEVRAYDEETLKTLKARYPKKAQKATTGIGTKKNEVVIMTVSGVRDTDTLARLAQTAYELIARSEQQVKITTRDMVDKQNFDLINVKTGDYVFVIFQPFNGEMLETLPAPQRTAWLRDRGFSNSAAQVLSDSYSSQTSNVGEGLGVFRRPFYVREAEITWSADDGFELSLDMVNYVNQDGVSESGDVKGAAELGENVA